MYRLFFVLFTLQFFHQSAVAQCAGKCADVLGELIDYCYTTDEFPGKCGQFLEDSSYFFFQDPTRKKDKIIRFSLPNFNKTKLDTYLLTLQTDKKLKISPSDLLFIRQAIEVWNAKEVIRKWNPELINSGMTIRPSGLAYRVIENGNGKLPESGKKVTVHYTGWLSDGTKFDSSWDLKRTYSFYLGKNTVIKGWEEGISLLPVGTSAFFRIPPDLGYGNRQQGDMIPPNSVLYFEVKLISAE